MKVSTITLEIHYDERTYGDPNDWDWFTLLEMDGEPDEITLAEDPEGSWFRIVQ